MDGLTRLRTLTKNIRTSTSVLLWVFSLGALGIGIASFIVPPTGVIDPSVLRFVAELFAIMALLEAREAILEGLGVKVTHGNTSVEIKDTDGPQPEEPKTEDDAED